jgi:hypothetical protein
MRRNGRERFLPRLAAHRTITSRSGLLCWAPKAKQIFCSAAIAPHTTLPTAHHLKKGPNSIQQREGACMRKVAVTLRSTCAPFESLLLQEIKVRSGSQERRQDQQTAARQMSGTRRLGLSLSKRGFSVFRAAAGAAHMCPARPPQPSAAQARQHALPARCQPL